MVWHRSQTRSIRLAQTSALHWSARFAGLHVSLHVSWDWLESGANTGSPRKEIQAQGGFRQRGDSQHELRGAVKRSPHSEITVGISEKERERNWHDDFTDSSSLS